MTIETLIAISVTVIAAIMVLAAWIMQERSILSTDSVMNSLNMGIVPVPDGKQSASHCGKKCNRAENDRKHIPHFLLLVAIIILRQPP